MAGEDEWRPNKEKSEFILHVPSREKAYYQAMSCAGGSPRVVGECRAS